MTHRRFQLALLIVIVTCITAGCAVQRRPDRWLLSYDGSYKRSVASDTFFARAFTGPPAAECRRGLFTGVIFLGVQAAPSGRWFAAWANTSSPAGDATLNDWFDYVDTLTAPHGAFARLESATRHSSRSPVEIAVMLPAPVHDVTGSFRIASEVLDLSEEALRKVYDGYIDTLQVKFEHGRFDHLRLGAVYWLREEAWGADGELARRVAKIVHARGLRFLWIPYWGAGQATQWMTLGFDAAWQQPNYFFHRELQRPRLDSAVARAKGARMGLEIELDGRVFTDSTAVRRLGDYIQELERERRFSIAVYDGGGVLAQLFADRSAPLIPTRNRLAAALCR